MNYFKKDDTEYYIDTVEDYREWKNTENISLMRRGACTWR